MEQHGTDHSTAGLSAERIARNDAIFRNANEGISEAAEAAEIEDRVPLICECADPACREIVQMSMQEYREIREDPRLFWNVPGHEASTCGSRSARWTTCRGRRSLMCPPVVRRCSRS